MLHLWVLHAQINICACAVCGLVTGTLYAVPSTLIACATLMPDPAGGLAAKTKDKTKGHHQFSRTMGKFVVRQREKVNKGVRKGKRERKASKGFTGQVNLTDTRGCRCIL